MDLQKERHHLEHIREKFCKRRGGRHDAHRSRERKRSCLRRTLNVVLEDLGEDGEEGLLEAADCGRVGFAGDPHGQAQRLEQVVIEMRLAGVLEIEILEDLIQVFKKNDQKKV